MQFKLSLLALGFLSIPAAANPVPQTINQCNTGNALCCNQVVSKNGAPVPALFELFGIPIESVVDLVGLTCTPITVIGVGGATCAQQPVCCTRTWFNGLIADGCTPIQL